MLVLAGACTDETLIARICRPGEIRCVEAATIDVCNATGTAFVPGVCQTGFTCVADVCEKIICTPGERFCYQDEADPQNSNVFIMECNDTGTGGCAVESCASPPLDGMCVGGGCLAVCSAEQKSYLGCEYFAADLDNAYVSCSGDPNGQFCDAQNAQFAVVVSNPDANLTAYVIITKGEVEAFPTPGECVGQPRRLDNFVRAAAVPPRGLVILDLPPRNINATVKDTLAYRVASNIPITAYQFNPLENVDVFSNDASLLLPTTAADTAYYAMTRQLLSEDLRPFVTVVGIDHEPTEVTVTVSATTGGGPGIPPLARGQSFTTSLNRYQVLNLEAIGIGSDLTGTTIVAERPVVAYSGNEAANAPDSVCDLNTNTCVWAPEITCGCAPGAGADCNPHLPCLDKGICCADHLEMQLFGLSAWGNEYLAVRSWRRGLESDLWRVLASQDDTSIQLDPPVIAVPVLDAGEWFEFESNDDFLLRANAPVFLGQFLAGEQAPLPGTQPGDAGVGDPAFTLATPLRQLRESYVFLAPNKYEQDYVSVGVQFGSLALLDGTPMDQLDGVEIVPQVGSTTWQVFRAPIADGRHTLDCNLGCSVMVHGYDQYVSYAYPGGMNLLECSRDADCPVGKPTCVDFVCVAD